MEQREENKILSPKLDVVFQALFGEPGSEKVTKCLIESIIDEKIEKIELDKNPILRRETKDDKLGVLDIIAQIDEKEICNIELQVVEKDNFEARLLFYWSRLYSKEIKRGNDYNLLKKTIVIAIVDFELNGEEECHTKWTLNEKSNRKRNDDRVLTDLLELHIIQLPKKGKLEGEPKLLDWLNFLEDPEDERVIERMKENKDIKEAREKLDVISADKDMQRIAELRLKAIMDEKATYRLGEKRGEEKEKRETAKRLIKCKLDIETIMTATGLKREEIEELMKS